jgi:hypothetical protein
MSIATAALQAMIAALSMFVPRRRRRRQTILDDGLVNWASMMLHLIQSDLTRVDVKDQLDWVESW